jgi:hypothetical protein
MEALARRLPGPPQSVDPERFLLARETFLSAIIDLIFEDLVNDGHIDHDWAA